MGVKTRGSAYFKEPREEYHDVFDFETIPHFVIEKVIYKAQVKEEDTAFVLGCGKGRVVCHLARRKVRKVIRTGHYLLTVISMYGYLWELRVDFGIEDYIADACQCSEDELLRIVRTSFEKREQTRAHLNKVIL